MEDWLSQTTDPELKKEYAHCEGIGVVIWMFIAAGIMFLGTVGTILYHYLS